MYSARLLGKFEKNGINEQWKINWLPDSDGKPKVRVVKRLKIMNVFILNYSKGVTFLTDWTAFILSQK